MQMANFEEEIRSGDLHRVLAALRDLLAAELAVKTGSGVPALARVLLDVLRDIGKLPSEKPGRSIADELKEMREARLSQSMRQDSDGLPTASEPASLNARGQPRMKRQGGRKREQFPRQKGS
jgi:hypothetical protein